jgi:Pretoxin HINT domain
MLHAILLCCAIFDGGSKPAESNAADRSAYEAAAAKAGKNATANVQLALWCEAHGFMAERAKHLTLAVSLDPANTQARGLLGLVPFQGKWAKPNQVEQEIQNDPRFQALFREYLDRRVQAPRNKADAQLRLANWCLEHGLNEEAMAHYFLVTRLEPARDIAWIRLGYKKHKDRWFKPEDLAAQKLEADRQKRADLQWKSRLEKLRDGLESKIEARRLKSEREVYQVNDPRAVPLIAMILGNGSEQSQVVAVELLSQIEGPAASFWLAALAIKRPSPAIRDQARRALARRDPRDIIGWLVTVIHKPYQYELTQDQGPGTPALLKVNGERFDLERFYEPPPLDLRLVPVLNFTSGMQQASANVGHTGSARSAGQMLTSAFPGTSYFPESSVRSQQVAALTQRRIEDDVRDLEERNAEINQTNERALPLLESLTNQNFGVDPEQWKKWWTEQLGYVYDSRYSEDKPLFTEVIVPHTACFAAGTLVQTVTGPRKIESIAAGDRVLSQQSSTGALSFQPVFATHLNGPSQTLRIALGSETIVATGIHRFWKAGNGWTMARDLKSGDRLRMIGGIVSIQSIEPGPTQKVYNLTVAENHNFLVGSAGLLVHDFGFVQPVSEPFDRLANTAAIASK